MMRKDSVKNTLNDIKPSTEISNFNRSKYRKREISFDVGDVAKLVGMSQIFISKIISKKKYLAVKDVMILLDQDSFQETYVPRSKVLDYLIQKKDRSYHKNEAGVHEGIHHGNALEIINYIEEKSIQCVVTSTPYWGMRIYETMESVKWADGEFCPLGHEQTPEGFIRHSIEILVALQSVMTDAGSIWWNIMDSYNTRTQIRASASEALRAMEGKEERSWEEYSCRRYSAGHSFLKDGEQCLIPTRIAERAARVGYYVKSIITWSKSNTLPEPQRSRVSRSLEYILHLSLKRAPLFNKEAYQELPSELGGRNIMCETAKLSDVWHMPTSAGRNGHGAQFPISLPGRCIALSSNIGDTILDPFLGAGTTALAAKKLGRKFIGIDVSEEYIKISKKILNEKE